MEIKLVVALILVLATALQVKSTNPAEEKIPTKPPANFNPLEDLILNQSKNGFKPESVSRVKRQYPYYYYRRYPSIPVPIIIGGFGGFGGGLGRGFNGGFGRGFGGGFGRGFGGGFGRGFGGGFGRGFGGGFGRGFGGRGGGFGGRGGGFGGRGGGFGGRGGGGGRG